MKHLAFMALALGLAQAASVCAQQAATGIDAQLDVGAEYDSRLSVEQLDKTVNASDTATVVKAKVNGHWLASDRLTLKGGVSHLGKHHHEQSEFDIAINQVFVDGSYDFDQVTLGASHYAAAAQLDDDALLDLNLSSIYLSRLFADRLFVRLAGTHTKKAFDDRSERDADNNGVDGALYYFFNSARSFVSLGIGYSEEDAAAAELDYHDLSLKTRLQTQFSALGKASNLALSYHHVARDYDHINPQLGAERADSRHTSKLEWELEMLPHLALVSALEYREFDSNLAAVNYSETLASVALRLKL